MPHTPHVTVVGGGLAGAEAAWQLAQRGVRVTLLEMRPLQRDPAHHTDALAELVCSNSFKSDDPSTAAGSLKHEADLLGSMVLACARATAVPAGAALAVDRERFSERVTRILEEHPFVEVVREEAIAVPDGDTIVATGPLTSDRFAEALSSLVGHERLAFFDAAAPIVDAASLDRSIVFAASRYGKGNGADYLNAPMDEAEYAAFLDALLSASRVHAKEFETKELFQACQPVEEVARTGRDAIRFGALKPVGLTDPRTGRRPHAVVQLRAEDRAGSAYNLVGFQTNLTFPEQQRVFRMIPGLKDAEFLRCGVMHRNTFVDAPRLLGSDLSLRSDPRVALAGQLTGTEGYLEAVAGGLLAALGTLTRIRGLAPVALPADTVFGALIAHATDPKTRPYQPMHVNYGIVPPLDPPIRGKRERYAAYAARADTSLRRWLAARTDLGVPVVRDAAERAGGAS